MGAARSITFDGTDLIIRGYWAHPRQELTVELPLLQHGFYPKLDHTPTDIKQHIIIRRITLPSVLDMEKAGYQVDNIIIITEINVHPKNQKNYNYFRTDFPATLKSLARRYNVVFILPAFDIPSAKIVRKQTLKLWRSLGFPPLMIKGKQFTSGRMQYFIVPNNADVMKNWRKTMNFEAAEEIDQMLTEASRRNRRSRRNKIGNVDVRSAYDPEVEQLIRGVERQMRNRTTPVIINVARRHGHILGKKEVNATLADGGAKALMLQAALHPKNLKKAAIIWTKEWLWPRITALVEKYGEEALRDVFRTAYTVIVSAVTYTILSSIAASENPNLFQRILGDILDNRNRWA